METLSILDFCLKLLQKVMGKLWLVVAIITVVYFKPIVLWGIAGEFNSWFHSILVTAWVLVGVLIFLVWFYRNSFNERYKLLLWHAACPIVANVAFNLVGKNEVDFLQLQLDTAAYMQALSAEYKITFETISVMKEYYEVALFWFLVLVQLVIWTLVVNYIMFSLAFYRFDTIYALLNRVNGDVLLMTIVGVVLSTNIVYVVLDKALSYFL